MLRITASGGSGKDACVKLEGRLLGPWVDEVRGLFAAVDVAPAPRLDLSGLTFVDAAGAELLRHLLGQGAQVESCTPYVAQLLHLNCDR